MKWLEILEGDVSSLINLDNIRLIQLCGSVIKVYEIHAQAPYVIKSSRDFDAQLKYSLIRSYVNYGPTGNVLTIETE